jgi:1-acyl-sn-glycerol-3-phosphate acyltransferase
MLYPFTRIVLGTIIKIYMGNVEGKENLPKGPFIFAANHASFMDDFILPYTIQKNTNKKFHIFVNSRFYKNYFFKKFLEHYECIPVDAAKDQPDEKKRKQMNEEAFAKAQSYLKKGELFGIFPEGGRSDDGKLKKAKVGVAKVALESKVPIVPIGIKGSYDIMPKGARFPRFKKADVIIGMPVDLSRYHGKEKDYKTLNEVTRIIMKEIAVLSKQDYPY